MHEHPCLPTCHKFIHARPKKYQVGTFSIETCLWDVCSKATTLQTLPVHFSTLTTNTNHHAGFTQNEVMPDADLSKIFIKMRTMHIILAINAYYGDIPYKNVTEWLGQWNKWWNGVKCAHLGQWAHLCCNARMRQCLCGSEVQYGMCVFMFEDLSKRIFGRRLHFCCQFWCLNIYSTSKVAIRDKSFHRSICQHLQEHDDARLRCHMSLCENVRMCKVRCVLWPQDTKGALHAKTICVWTIWANARVPFVTKSFHRSTTTGKRYLLAAPHRRS